MTNKTVKKKSAPKKKSAKPASKKTATPEEPTLKIIFTSKCPTVSNESNLTYNVGSDDKDEIYIRVLNNSGCGHFSDEWIALDDITSILSDTSNGGPITSIHLIPLFQGKSVNTPAFLAAILLHEGVLSLFEDKKHSYVYSGVDKFLAKVKKAKTVKKTK